MSKMKKGFTLIEVMLFMVLTGALFVAVAVGTHNSVYQQRYNDSIQNFVEFLRGIYSQVSNVENRIDGGRSSRAIYGKLITFGESYDLAEQPVKDRNAVFTYDVIGKIGDIGTSDALTALNALDANVIFFDGEEGGSGEFYTAGMEGSYTPRWGARIEKASGHTDFTGSILIVRHPRSGSVFTYYLDKVLQVNKAKAEQNYVIQTAADETQRIEAQSASINPLKGELSNFTITDIDFCVNPRGDEASRLRRDVRLVKGARNASGIVLIDEDRGDNRCLN